MLLFNNQGLLRHDASNHNQPNHHEIAYGSATGSGLGNSCSVLREPVALAKTPVLTKRASCVTSQRSAITG